MTQRFSCHSPADGSLVAERAFATSAELDSALDQARRAQRAWAATPLAERLTRLTALVDWVVMHKTTLAEELTAQMGRPIRYAPGEIGGFEVRGRTMIELAPEALADVRPPEQAGYTRFIRRAPLGVVLVMAPWNYPWLTSVNAVIPALAAGNAVILKHARQTPLVAERFAQAGREAGLPDGLLTALHLDHDLAAAAITDPRLDYVAFTGSVDGGHAVRSAAAKRFIATGLELGGKDPAYVRADADLKQAVDGIVDGAFFNSGQSCCGIERVYVHESLFDDFVEQSAALVRSYVLGDPREPETTLGPVVRASAAKAIVAQIEGAIAAGARPLIDAKAFGERTLPYLAPQVLVDVDHTMDVMREETFGPVVGIMSVPDDETALTLMNDSRYGLTASIWTRDEEAALTLGPRIETGTVFMNRCDYLDPYLAWTGVKDSGRGATLSLLGYEGLTRPQSFHLRLGRS